MNSEYLEYNKYIEAKRFLSYVSEVLKSDVKFSEEGKPLSDKDMSASIVYADVLNIIGYLNNKIYLISEEILKENKNNEEDC